MATLTEKLSQGYNVDDDLSGDWGHKIANYIYLTNLASYYEDRENRSFERNKLKTPPREENVQKRYKQFYSVWATSRINENDFGSDSDKKREALLIFPTFGKNGARNIEKLDDVRVGSLYKKMLDYSKERVSK